MIYPFAGAQESLTAQLSHGRELVKNFVGLGQEVIAVSPVGDPEQLEREYRVKIPLKSIRNPNVIPGSICAALRSLFFLLFNKVDVIYERYGAFQVGPLLSRLLRIPLVIELNGIVEDEVKVMRASARNESLFSAIRRLPDKIGICGQLSYRLNKMIFNSAQGIIVVTVGIKKFLMSEFNVPAERIVVVPNGSNIELFRPMKTSDCQAYLGLLNDCNYVCYVGSFESWQGLKYLIDAAPLILREILKVKFLLVGGGPSYEDDNLIKTWVDDLGLNNQVIFRGRVPYKKVPIYINASDVCVAPFIKKRNERCGLSPLKIMEYLACGKPVVASDLEGVKELLKKSGGGMLVPPESSKQLANAIVTLLRNNELRHRMCEKARKYAVAHLNWKNSAEKILRTMKKVKKQRTSVLRTKIFTNDIIS